MDLYAWDTVYITTLAQANKSLAAGTTSLLTSFQYSDSNEAVNTTITASGTFGTWQIVGGSGKLLYLALPIKTGQLSASGDMAKIIIPDGEPIDLTGLTATFEVALDLLPSQMGQPNQKNYKLNFSEVGTTPGATTPKSITPRNLDDPNNKLSGSEKQSILNVIAACLVANVQNLTYVFATIDIAEPGSGTWLVSTDVDYYYFETEGDNAGYIAILGVTDGRDIGSMQRKVDAALLGKPATGVFAISENLFLKNVVQPTLPKAFGQGTSAKSFTYDSTSQAIKNTQNIPISSIKEGAVTYHPEITQLNIDVQDNALSINVQGSCDLYMGMSMNFSIQSKNPLTFDVQNQVLSFQHDPNPTVSHSSHVPWYDHLAGGIPDLIIAIIIPILTNEIGNAIDDKSSNLNVTNLSPQSIHWAGLNSFQAVNAGLSSNFYMLLNLSG